MEQKSILIISYHFPPSQAVGGQRSANFARFLPEHGWKTHVLTIDEKYIPDKDIGRLQGLENVSIHTTGKLPRLIELYHYAKKLKKLILPGDKGKGDGGTNPVVALEPKMMKKEGFKGKMKRYFSSLFLALPDFEKNWILPATVKAVSIIRKEKVDCILTSCPPYSVHIIGLLTNLLTGVKWIADYRDPWYVASQKRMYPTCTLSRNIEGFLERQVIKRSMMVLCNTDKLRNTLAYEYEDVKKQGFFFIPNGIATDLFKELSHLPKFTVFTLTYTGSLYFLRTPEPIFKALCELVKEEKIAENSFVIKLVGQCETIDGKPTRELVSSYSLDRYVEILPSVPYRESLELVKRSHIALLFAPDQPYQIPAKVYDYIGTGTQILALTGQGATSDILQQTATGEVFSPKEHEGIKAFLEKAINKSLSIPENVTKEATERFDRQRVAAELDTCVREMLSHTYKG